MTIDERPYAGTSGWSGSETSRDRALRQDAEGITANRQTMIWSHILAGQFEGATVAELRDLGTLGHHGSVSGALTCLDKAGIIVRLKQTRNKCAIYVLPMFVQGREVVPYKPREKRTL